MKQEELPLVAERRTVELCGEDGDGGRCIRVRGHAGLHGTLPPELAALAARFAAQVEPK